MNGRPPAGAAAGAAAVAPPDFPNWKDGVPLLAAGVLPNANAGVAVVGAADAGAGAGAGAEAGAGAGAGALAPKLNAGAVPVEGVAVDAPKLNAGAADVVDVTDVVAGVGVAVDVVDAAADAPNANAGFAVVAGAGVGSEADVDAGLAPNENAGAGAGATVEAPAAGDDPKLNAGFAAPPVNAAPNDGLPVLSAAGAVEVVGAGAGAGVAAGAAVVFAPEARPPKLMPAEVAGAGLDSLLFVVDPALKPNVGFVAAVAVESVVSFLAPKLKPAVVAGFSELASDAGAFVSDVAALNPLNPPNAGLLSPVAVAAEVVLGAAGVVDAGFKPLNENPGADATGLLSVAAAESLASVLAGPNEKPALEIAAGLSAAGLPNENPPLPIAPAVALGAFAPMVPKLGGAEGFLSGAEVVDADDFAAPDDDNAVSHDTHFTASSLFMT